MYRAIILLPFLLGAISVFVDFLPASLPEELGVYVNRMDVTVSFGFIDAVRITSFIFLSIATLGLLQFDNYSREIYLVSALVFILAKVGYDASVSIGYQAALDDLVKVSIGGVIGMIYFSNIWRDHITRKSSGTATPPAV